MSNTTLKILCILGCFLTSYFLGTFQPSYLLGMKIYHKDLRKEGSGNSGATNAIRVFGLKFGMFCLAIDAAKGALGVLFTRSILTADIIGSPDLSILFQLLSGVFVLIGHNHPFYMQFQGGKGVAASLGIMLVIDWRVFLLAAVPALIVLLSSRIMSISSLTFEFVCFIAFVIFYFQSEEFYWIVLSAAMYPILSFVRHRNNLARLVNGKEPKLWGAKPDAAVREKKNSWGTIVDTSIPEETEPEEEKSKMLWHLPKK
ncbi:MAG TPA: glycerol-3-phosphate 1-O-acyltransferase PlsY [Clostridiales bacterium]|nr:glycerol-3-phosphate 1-O-acyltransferase PlsY [Clostridiales bacterium]